MMILFYLWPSSCAAMAATDVSRPLSSTTELEYCGSHIEPVHAKPTSMMNNLSIDSCYIISKLKIIYHLKCACSIKYKQTRGQWCFIAQIIKLKHLITQS